MSVGAIERLLSCDPFASAPEVKHSLFMDAMKESFKHHLGGDTLFANYCRDQGFALGAGVDNLANYPYVPVKVFKKRNLTSVPEEKIRLVLKSSATTGVPSTVAIDDLTAKRQAKVSAKIMASYLGSVRRPFLVLDEDPRGAVSRDISARSAATRGFMTFGHSFEYFLKEACGELQLDVRQFEVAVKRYADSGEPVLIFGFTFILHRHLVKVLRSAGKTFQLPAGSAVAHIGGWKKLVEEKVSRREFLDDIEAVLGVPDTGVVDFYGFTEQMGLVYANVGMGPKTTPVYSEIVIRDFQTMNPVPDGDVGLIQMLTPVPNSYPGISVLTEDVGRIMGRGQDENGRWGTQFEVLGRAQEAETRGCGDVLAESVV